MAGSRFTTSADSHRWSVSHFLGAKQCQNIPSIASCTFCCYWEHFNCYLWYIISRSQWCHHRIFLLHHLRRASYEGVSKWLSIPTSCFYSWKRISKNLTTTYLVSDQDYWKARDSLILTYQVVLPDKRIVIPTKFRKQILNNHHSAHQGTATMLVRANESIYWKGIHNRSKLKQENCKSCSWSFQRICGDYVYYKAHSYLTIADRFSGCYNYIILDMVSNYSKSNSQLQELVFWIIELLMSLVQMVAHNLHQHHLNYS